MGASLALNRLGVCFYKVGQFDKSLLIHKKHLACTDQDNSFASLYNIGICYRALERPDQAHPFFERALDWALCRKEPETICIAKGQMAITFLFLRTFEESVANFIECIELCRKMDSYKILLECHLSLGYLFWALRDCEQSSKNFEAALEIAKQLGDKKIANLCLCNLGISGAHEMMSKVQIDLEPNIQE